MDIYFEVDIGYYPPQLERDDEDLDDALNDLLADFDDVPKKKNTTPAVPASSKVSSSNKTDSSDFLADTVETKSANKDLKTFDADIFTSQKVIKPDPTKSTSPIHKPANIDSKWLEDRPPTRSGQKNLDTSSTRKNSDDFDDDGGLFGLGLDSPQPIRKQETNSSYDSSRRGSAKSVLDDLLGKKSERPPTGEQRLNSNSMLSKSDQEKKDAKDDTFQFGSYTPSAVNTSRPSSKRSVRFEDDGFSDRPSSSNLRNTAPASFLESVVEKDDRNWLDIASGSTAATSTSVDGLFKPKNSDRSKSEGLVADKVPSNSNKKLFSDPDPISSEPVDWLGFSRLGSPDTGHRRLEDGDSVPDKHGSDSKDTSILKSSKDKKIGSVPVAGSEIGDWLDKKEVSHSVGSPNWLNEDAKRTSGKNDEKNTFLSDLNVEKKRNSLDFLGVSSEKDNDDDWINTLHKKQPDSMEARPQSAPDSSPLPWMMEGKNKQHLQDEATLFPFERQSESRQILMKDDLDGGPGTHVKSNLFGSHLQEEKLQQNQTLFLQQQDEMQKQFKLQQAQLQKQMALQQQQQQQLLQQQQLMQQQVLSDLPMMYSTTNFDESKVKHLEIEKQFLENMIETLKKQHEEEKKMLEECYSKRLQLNTETFKNCEERLKQENAMMSEEVLEKVKLLEKEKSELLTMHLKKQSDWDQEKQNEIEHLKNIHRVAIEDLRREHDEALQRITKVKNQELEAISSSRDHAKNLESAINQMRGNTMELQELHSKVEFQHSNSLMERENNAKSRDESLKILQDRLERQQHDNELERARLLGLVTKLETQLTEQTQELEQDRWRIRQEENNLKISRNSIEQERIHLMEIIQRDRIEIEKAKTKLLEDQQRMMTEMNMERLQLSEERAKFNVTVKFKQDQDERNSAKVLQSETELNSGLEAIAEERNRLEHKKQELENLAKKLNTEKNELDQQKSKINIEKHNLEQLAVQVQQKSQEIEEYVTNAAAASQDGQKLYNLAKQAELENNKRLHKIQTDLQTLRIREKQITEERLSLAREKSSLESTKNSMLCSVCKGPMLTMVQTGYPQTSNFLGATNVNEVQLLDRNKPTSHNLAEQPYSSQPMNNIYASIQMDKSVRLWKIAAEKDKDFLEEESYFLEAIKHTPYHFGPQIPFV